MKQRLPIGNDQFQIVRAQNAYYVDKTMMIKDFLDYGDVAALITRPRRFGKTLNMTMLREFFDITKNSSSLFEGLDIMKTPYRDYMNSKPVIYISFKDCSGDCAESLRRTLANEILKEYSRYKNVFDGQVDVNDTYVFIFYQTFEKLRSQTISLPELSFTLEHLLRVVADFYHIAPILLIDEYDQPILSSYENGYHSEVRDFFSILYGSALKGNEYLGQALLTGIQRVAKESIFSRLNNIQVYTILDTKYEKYFGLTESETQTLLEYYGLELSADVKAMYDGYMFGKTEIYNPWSIIKYADSGRLENYWTNTSTNYLIRESLREADASFLENFEQLIIEGRVEVAVNLETSFMELKDEYALWGLLINSGYLKIDSYSGTGYGFAVVRIPNREVKSEFQALVAEYTGISNNSLQFMFHSLMEGKMDDFFQSYKKIVLNCTSYYDAKENAYHMLFLGMCITLDGIYKVTSNLESGLGRSDITLEAKNARYPSMIIEFKQGENVEQLKKDALNQIIDKQYDAGLHGNVLYVGIAHDGKKCDMVYRWR